MHQPEHAEQRGVRPARRGVGRPPTHGRYTRAYRAAVAARGGRRRGRPRRAIEDEGEDSDEAVADDPPALPQGAAAPEVPPDAANEVEVVVIG